MIFFSVNIAYIDSVRTFNVTTLSKTPLINEITSLDTLFNALIKFKIPYCKN